MNEIEARQFEAIEYWLVEHARRSWRWVVASRKSVRIIKSDAIHKLIAAGCIIIAAAGGGGITVVPNHKGELHEIQGVPAVISEDWVSGLIATNLDIDLLLILQVLRKSHCIIIHLNRKNWSRCRPHNWGNIWKRNILLPVV
jgi:carbamate kinase